MTDPSKPLPNARHEAFAVHYAGKGNGAQAWMAATGGDGKHANANGSKWVKIGSISERVAWIKAEAVRRLNKDASKAGARPALTLMRKRILLACIAEDGQKDADRINAIKADNDLAGEGSEAEANKALSAVAVEALNRIFGAA